MTNCYLLIKGVVGTSTVKKDAIEIMSFSWGAHNAAASAKPSATIPTLTQWWNTEMPGVFPSVVFAQK